MSIPCKTGLESVQGATTRWFPVSWQQSLTPMAFTGFAVPVSDSQDYADPSPQYPPSFYQGTLEKVMGDQPEKENLGPQQSINAFKMSPFAAEFNSIPLQDLFLDHQAYFKSYEEEKTNKWNFDAEEFIPRAVHAQQDGKFCLNLNTSEFKPRDTSDNQGRRDQQVSTDHPIGTATITEASQVDKICALNPNAIDFKPKCPHAMSVPSMIQENPEAKDEAPAPVEVCQQVVHKHEEEEEESVASSHEVVEAKKRLIKLVRVHQQKCPQSIEAFCGDIRNSTCSNHAFMEEYTSVYGSLIHLFGQEVDNKMDRSDRRKHFGVLQPKPDKLSIGNTANRAELDNGTIKVRELTKQGEVVHVEPILAFVSSTGQNSHCVNCFKQVASVVQCCRATFCSEVCSTEAIQNGRHNPVSGGLFPELGKNANLVYQLVVVAGLDQTRAIIRSNLAEAVTSSVEPVLLLEAIYLKVVLERTLAGGTEQDQYHIPILYSMLAALKCNPLCCDSLEEWQARVQSGPAKSLQSTQVRCGYALTEFSSAPGALAFSCAPNTFRRLNHAEGVIEYVARRALHPGEQITLTWGLNEKRFPVGEKRRKTEIKNRFNVICQCVKCDPDWRKD